MTKASPLPAWSPLAAPLNATGLVVGYGETEYAEAEYGEAAYGEAE
jgi:hypothetical protein